MIEEAAGTRMYEAKKQQAEKTIEKKDAKLKEINDILAEEINPTLTKLKEERSAYLEYQKIQRELEHLTKFYLAYKFVCAEEASSKTEEELENLKTKLEEIQVSIKEGEEEVSKIEAEIKELERERDNEIGDRVADKEATLKDMEKKEAKESSALKTLKDNVKQEVKKRVQIEKNISEDQKALKTKEKAMEGMQGTFDKLREEDERCQVDLEKAQATFQAASLGEEVMEGGGSATLQEQIMTAKQEISGAETEIKSADTKTRHFQDQLKKKQVEMKKTEAEYKRDSGSLSKYEKEVAELNKKLGGIKYEEGQAERLEQQQRTLRHQVNALKTQVESVDNRHPNLNFRYQNPGPGFDKRKVKGVAAKLFKVCDEKFASGLQAVAGGKIYNVVVEDDNVAKQLLDNGRLTNRVTFIPLNKISSKPLSRDEVDAAIRSGGRDNVWNPLDLVRYEEAVKPAIIHLMGRNLLCRDIATARKVCMEVKIDCYTLDGDKFSSSGDMSGGAPPRGNDVLRDLCSVHHQEVELRDRIQELQTIEDQLRKIGSVAEQYKALSEQLEIKSTELGLIRGRLEQTVHHQLAEEVKQLERDIEGVKEGVQQAKALVKERTQKVKDLEYKVKNAKAIKDKLMKTAEEQVKKCKKAAEESKARWSAKEQEEGSLRLELDELKKSISNAEEQLKLVAQTVTNWESQISEQKEKVDDALKDVNVAKDALKQQKDLLSAQIKEIKSRTDKKDGINKKVVEKGLEIQQLNHNITKSVEDVKEASRKVKNMLSEHQWINEDRQYFGQVNSTYDFKANDPVEAGRKIQKLEGTKDKLSKSVNMRAMNMLGKAEEQYGDLLKKKKIVENDKNKIMEVIAELDQKKREALRQAWDQVNKDFGSIYSSLLPGATAKLEPPQGQDVLDGLEVKVAFGGVWKESLSELSGGQRSLVALSLILSLLLFKPAPLYILDEVDAALDLSHTQNIGQMLKNHFKHSQFIVVSLKDGMFNNANVLYRTKFVDGMSTVSRTTQAQRK